MKLNRYAWLGIWRPWRWHSWWQNAPFPNLLHMFTPITWFWSRWLCEYFAGKTSFFYYKTVKNYENDKITRVLTRVSKSYKAQFVAKGQLTSKCLFCYLQLFQKTNEKIRPNYNGTSYWIVFVGFLEELKTPKRNFEINWPLVEFSIGHLPT